MSTEYKRLPRCGIDNCKQTLFYLETGRWFCKNGHMREGELELAADDDGFGQSGSRAARAIVETKRVAKVLRGRKGFELYIQCFQIVLQKQIWWLVKEKGFPEELEVIVRDLWALRLQVLTSTLPENISSQAPGSQRSQRSQRQQTEEEGYSSQSSYLYSSDSDVASTTYSSRKRRARRVPKAADRPKLVESLALCYLGTILLRSAVSLGELHRWVEAGKLPFIRAIKQVPPAMKAKLSAEYRGALEPRTNLLGGKLYKTVHSTVAMLHEQFGITFPPINREVLLGRMVNELGLPLEIYTASKRLSDRLFATFEWPALSLHKLTSQWPEVKLCAFVIVATKLCYSLDSLQRTPRTVTEPAATQVSWEAWEAFLRGGNDERAGLLGKPGAQLLEVDVKEQDVFSMDPDQLDMYLDWYEKNWCLADEDIAAPKISQGILNLFPTSRQTPAPASQPVDEDSSLAKRLAALHAETVTIPADNESPGLLRPGEAYLWHRADDMPQSLQTLMQAAADMLAVERADLQSVVRGIEMGIRKQIKAKKAEERRKKTMGAAAKDVGPGEDEGMREEFEDADMTE